MEKVTDSYRIWQDRVGVNLPNISEFHERDIAKADFEGLTLRFQYMEASVDRCFYALLRAEDLLRLPIRRFVYKLFHRAPKQTTFDIDNPKEWEKAHCYYFGLPPTKIDEYKARMGEYYRMSKDWRA